MMTYIEKSEMLVIEWKMMMLYGIAYFELEKQISG